MTIAQDIAQVIVREWGPHTALAVLAALDVAAERWTDEDTTKYGTVARDGVREIVRQR